MTPGARREPRGLPEPPITALKDAALPGTQTVIQVGASGEGDAAHADLDVSSRRWHSLEWSGRWEHHRVPNSLIDNEFSALGEPRWT